MFRTHNNDKTLPVINSLPAFCRRVSRLSLLLAGFCCVLGTACRTGKSVASRQSSSRTVHVIRDSSLLQQRADSLFFSAERSKMLGDYRTAITQFSDYLRLKRNNPTAYYELARLFIEVRNPQYALGFARRAANMDTANKWFQITLADAFGVNAQFDSSAAVYDRLSRRYPENEEYIYNKGMFLSKADKTEAALVVFDTLEARTGLVEELAFQKQRLYLKLNRIDDAAAEVQKLINQNPEEVRYYLILGDIYNSNDRVEEATAIYNEVLTRDSTNPRALIALSGYAKKDGDTVQYWRYLTRAFTNPDYSIDEKVAYVYPYLQMQKLDTSKLKEGLQLSQLVINAHPDEAKAYALQADMFSQAGMLDSALIDYNKAVTLDSTRFTVWYQLMWLYSRKEDPANLLKVSSVVSERFPKEFMGHYFKGVANFLLQNYPASIDALNMAVQNGNNGDKGTRADVYSLLGDAYHATGQHQLSDSCYDKSLAIRPNDALVLNNFSYYLSLRGEQLNKAESMSKRSLELEPESANFMDTYAWILFRLARYEQAKEWMEKALQHEDARENPGMLEHYGDILFNLHEVDKALEYWQLAKQKGANSVGLARKIAEKRYILATERE
ncbi:Tetratricopeptide repeat-containing protein [Chitinophaga sp. YR627]|uniref:tetratricopeptide repeat protein n=1 Tax=Chitinophaga sp. YR627 TaxID=1881041 RepID=UPI0008F186E6|nr:tetratricopeptide repeat protein [Chitinophaga sp. YR627]SFN95804.1 Tetratricopeptide repeat-containing protein [Chitinophaga sp. YR627]